MIDRYFCNEVPIFWYDLVTKRFQFKTGSIILSKYIEINSRVVKEVSKIMKTYQDINKETIDRWVEEGWEWENQFRMMNISVQKMENRKFFLLRLFQFHMSGLEI